MDPLKMYFPLKMVIFQPAMLVYQKVQEVHGFHVPAPETRRVRPLFLNHRAWKTGAKKPGSSWTRSVQHGNLRKHSRAPKNKPDLVLSNHFSRGANSLFSFREGKLGETLKKLKIPNRKGSVRPLRLPHPPWFVDIRHCLRIRVTKGPKNW